VEKVLEQVLGEHSLDTIRQCVGPEIEHVPREHPIVMRNEIEIDEPVEHPLSASQVQKQRRVRRRHRIGAPHEVARKRRIQLCEPIQRKHRRHHRRASVRSPAIE